MVHLHYPKVLDDKRYLLGTTAAILLGTLALGGAAVASTAINASASKSANKKADDATAKAKAEAEQKTLNETEEEKKTSAARRSLLAAPTSGFGPNPNLARSFLTTL